MRVDFFSNVGSGVRHSEACFVYELLREENMQSLKMQSERMFFQFKWLGLFFLASIAFIFIEGRNPNAPISYLAGIVAAGITCLLGLISSIPQDFEYDLRIACSVKKGKKLEQEYPDIIETKYFHVFDEAYNDQLILLTRFFPSGVIALVTMAAGVALALKAGLWLAASVFVLSLVVLAAIFFSFRRMNERTKTAIKRFN